MSTEHCPWGNKEPGSQKIKLDHAGKQPSLMPASVLESVSRMLSPAHQRLPLLCASPFNPLLDLGLGRRSLDIGAPSFHIASFLNRATFRFPPMLVPRVLAFQQQATELGFWGHSNGLLVLNSLPNLTLFLLKACLSFVLRPAYGFATACLFYLVIRDGV